MAQRRHIVYPDADPQLAELITGDRLRRLEDLGTFKIHFGRPADTAQFIERIADASGVLLGWGLPTEAMRRSPRLEVVSFTGIGAANFVDLTEAARLGITVTNTPGYADNAVAEHALALLFAAARQVARLDRNLRQGEWGQSQPALELRGKTLGLIGFGGIGARLAEMARGLGIRVRAWTRNPSKERAERHGVEFVSLDKILEESDILSLHLALTPETEGFLGAEELDRVKHGAVIVNTARAELLDEAALVERLRSARIAAAGLDVYSNEPLPADHPLLELENTVLTPHVGFNTSEAIGALLDIAVDNLVRYFNGAPTNVVASPQRRG